MPPLHVIYRDRLRGYVNGEAIWQPNEVGAVGDIGYINDDGQFVRLFNAFDGDGISPPLDGKSSIYPETLDHYPSWGASFSQDTGGEAGLSTGTLLSALFRFSYNRRSEAFLSPKDSMVKKSFPASGRLAKYLINNQSEIRKTYSDDYEFDTLMILERTLHVRSWIQGVVHARGKSTSGKLQLDPVQSIGATISVQHQSQNLHDPVVYGRTRDPTDSTLDCIVITAARIRFRRKIKEFLLKIRAKSGEKQMEGAAHQPPSSTSGSSQSSTASSVIYFRSADRINQAHDSAGSEAQSSEQDRAASEETMMRDPEREKDRDVFDILLDGILEDYPDLDGAILEWNEELVFLLNDDTRILSTPELRRERFSVESLTSGGGVFGNVSLLPEDGAARETFEPIAGRLKLTISNSAKRVVVEGMESTHAVVTEIRDEVKMLSREKQPTISNWAKLPARPTFFYGRDDSVNTIVELICASTGARIAIMGSGGIGKTSLSLIVIYDERVVGVVGDSRYFVSVEGASDVGAAAQLLAGQLGLPESSDPLSAAITHLATIPRALLIVDNLETLLFSKNAAAQKETERMLQRLAGIPTLTLIITSRGVVPPRGIRWSNAPSAGLEAISLGAARETFEQISGQPELASERNALDTLLANVDCVPLAVTLLAQLAQLQNPPSQLLQRWHRTKTGFIRSDGDDRESSVDVSIQISLDLLEGTRNGTEGQQLLSICAHLPDGLRPAVFDKLDDHFDDIHRARDLLFKFALVSIGADNELKMLSPVRHFVLKHHPMTMNHAAALRKIYFDIAASGPRDMDENFSRLSQNVAPEYGNLTSFLLHLIYIEEPSQELFDAIHAVSEYAYWTVPSTTLREAFRQRLDAYPVWLAPCLKDVARTQILQDEYALAVVNLNAARKLYATLGDKLQEAVCGQLLGNCLRIQDSLEAAERELLAAKDTFIEFGDEESAARCAMELGVICASRNDYAQAKIHFTSARDVFKRCGDRLGAAQCSHRLGTIQIALGNFSEADAELQSALAEFEALAELNGMAQCAVNLADLRVRQNDYDSAEKYLATARELFTRIGDRRGLAYCHWNLGKLRHAQGRLQDATENFSIAEEIYTAIGNQSNATECREMIAELRDSLY